MAEESNFERGRKTVFPGRSEIFIDRFYKKAEEFESPENCPRCKEPMPLLDSHEGPICSWLYGGCGYVPRSSKLKHKLKKMEHHGQ